MRKRMEVTISIIESLKQILLIVLFGALSCYQSVRAVSAIGQSERARLLTQTRWPMETQTKPAPKPTPPPAAAQPPQKVETPPKQEQNETIKINSSLVAVPVSVTDASGEPVRNLGAEDFQIEEEG